MDEPEGRGLDRGDARSASPCHHGLELPAAPDVHRSATASPSSPSGERRTPGSVQKKIQALVNDLKTAHPERLVELWFQDEARLGTKSVLRRCWAKRGVRPTAPHANGFEWTYIYGFVHPFSGRTDLLRFDAVDTPSFSAALSLFKARFDPADERLLVLVVDNAGWLRALANLAPGAQVIGPLALILIGLFFCQSRAEVILGVQTSLRSLFGLSSGATYVAGSRRQFNSRLRY